MTFPQKMILSAAAACACGWLCPDAAPVMKQIGGMFIDLLKMTVIPLAFISILYGIVKYGGEAGSMAGQALLLASVMTALAALIGMGMMHVLGVPVMDVPASVSAIPEPMTVLGFMRGCIPVNPVSAFVSGNMLQIITLAVFCGAVILRYFYCASVVRALSLAQSFCLRAADMVMRFAPVGVFALLYSTAASCPLNLLIGWASAGAALVCGMAVLLGAVSVPCLLLFRAPLRVISHMVSGDFIGAVCNGATNYLAPRMERMRDIINPAAVDLILPLVSVLMRAGSAVCVGVYTYFAAVIFGVDLTPGMIAAAAVITVAALTAAPGIIGGTLMDCAIIWTAVGIPLEAVALFAPIDFFLDVIRTVGNIHGGEVVTACVGKKKTWTRS